MSLDKKENQFHVYTITVYDDEGPKYRHWSEGLTMVIIKDGIKIKLNSDEVEQVVKALPKTIGGVYFE